jgi:hypothetical protein
MVMPVKYRVTYDDGTQETRVLPVEAWFAANRFTVTLDQKGKRVKRVEIDPEEQLPDTNTANNVWGR